MLSSCVTFILSSFVAVSSLATMKEFRWCCLSEAELRKCKVLANVTSQMTPLALARLACVYGESVGECIRMVDNGFADVITLGDEQIYSAGIQHGLVPVVAEDYGKHEEGLSDYAVALIRSNLSQDTSFPSLANLKSCHPSAGDSVGWQVPVGLLIANRGAVDWKDCDPFQYSANFFVESCVPGALSNEFNPHGTNPTKLCAICSDQKTCPRNVSERYYGYQGAFRCLTEGAGDVAFVSHLTVFQSTGKDNDLNPGKDFQLLCPDGTRAEVGAFQKCNLARIPSRVVMSRPGDNVRELMRWLLRLDREFREKPNMFQLFNSSTYGGRDLLFKDSTVKLVHLQERNTTKLWLGEKYFLELKTLSYCHYMAAASKSFADKLESLGRKRFSLISLTIIVFVLLLSA